MKYQLARRFLLHHFFRCRPHIRLHAASANRSLRRAVFPHQHPRTLKARDRSVRMHDRRQRAALPRSPHPHDFFKQVHAYVFLQALSGLFSWRFISLRPAFSAVNCGPTGAGLDDHHLPPARSASGNAKTLVGLSPENELYSWVSLVRAVLQGLRENSCSSGGHGFQSCRMWLPYNRC